MPYPTIADANPTAGTILTGNIRLALIGMSSDDVVHVECSDDDFVTTEHLETVRGNRNWSRALYEPRTTVKYRYRPAGAPSGDPIKYVLAGS